MDRKNEKSSYQATNNLHKANKMLVQNNVYVHIFDTIILWF